MSMSKKHFKAIAQIIADRDYQIVDGQHRLTKAEAIGYTVALVNLAEDLGNYFEAQNERFEYEQFQEACFTHSE